jgi:8-oxo-dGTP diphosphatase
VLAGTGIHGGGLLIREFSAGIIGFRETNKGPKYLLLLSGFAKKEMWEFPKGQIEKGEDAQTAALREFTEETGIEKCRIIPGYKHVLKYFYRRDGELINKTVTYFIGLAGEGQVKLSRESKDFTWLDVTKAAQKIRIKNVREMLLNADKFLGQRSGELFK